MRRRDFHRGVIGLGLAAGAAIAGKGAEKSSSERPRRKATKADAKTRTEFLTEPARKLPIRRFDVVVAGGGTAGVVAAIAAARTGAKTALIEAKGYTGGTVTEGGTALHSFYNLWTGFKGVAKRQVVKGIPQEIIDRLAAIGATSGHAPMIKGLGYDSVCTAIDTEMYKLVTMEMLTEAGVSVCVNTLAAGAVAQAPIITAALAESRTGREAFAAKAFVDCTAAGDLAAYAGAKYTEPNDYAVANSIGLANVSIDDVHAFFKASGEVSQLAKGLRSGRDGQVVRVQGGGKKLPEEFRAEAGKIGMSLVTTSTYDNYLMFVKLNFRMPGSCIDRDDVAAAEMELRKRQARAVELFRKYVPGCEKAFIARTSPRLNIRRGRCITCDHDITHEDVVGARHFEDDVMAYGFHDNAPRIQIRGGGTYGIPYRALRPVGLDNLLVAGMMITSDHRPHMSTRNTVCCMGQGQAAGTTAALCAANDCTTRKLPYTELRKALEAGGVYFES